MRFKRKKTLPIVLGTFFAGAAALGIVATNTEAPTPVTESVPEVTESATPPDTETFPETPNTSTTPAPRVPSTPPTHVPSPTPPPSTTEAPRGKYTTLVEKLRTGEEDNTGYAREKFGSRAPTATTRSKLIQEEQRPDGSWLSQWDGRTFTSPTGMDVDHTVALAEAWGSGASSWSESQRIAYANDLSSPYTLNLITAELNRGVKSDKDPFDWTPTVNKCEYVWEWTSIKLKWNLSADGEEKLALHNAALECDK